MWGLIRALRTNVDWWFKDHLTWSARVRANPVGSLAAWAERLSDDERERFEALRSRYGLEAWESGCTAEEVRLNLDHLDVLDQHLAHLEAPSAGLDVGCRSWWNLPANHAFRPTPWTGVELDAHQRYVDGTTRAAVARARLSHFPGATFRAGDLREITERFSLVLWLLPYVAEEAFDADRLPKRFFAPDSLLDHVLERLEPGGTLFIVNQGEDEAAVQRRMLEARGVAFEDLGRLQSVFSAFETPRYGLRCSLD